MKLRFMLAAVAAATLTFTPGCKSTSTGEVAAQCARGVEYCRYFGTVKRLQDHPGEREIFNVAVIACSDGVDQQNYDPIALTPKH